MNRRVVMGRYDENGPELPPKIRAAFDFLQHARVITEQTDASIPTRALTPLEKSVEAAALRAVQQYLLGETEFVEDAPAQKRRGGDDDSAPAAVNSVS